jgi:hypothetical protein
MQNSRRLSNLFVLPQSDSPCQCPLTEPRVAAKLAAATEQM